MKAEGRFTVVSKTNRHKGFGLFQKVKGSRCPVIKKSRGLFTWRVFLLSQQNLESDKKLK